MSLIPATEPFVHEALFYRSLPEYLAGTVGFVADGLARGEPVAVAVPDPNLSALRQGLNGAADRVRFVNMAEAGRNPGRIIPGVLREFADRYPDRPVRIIGEPIWPGRTEAEYPACAQHEALINLAFTGRTVRILCPYDTAGLDARALADAAGTHPTLVDAEGTRPSPNYQPAQVIATYNQPLPEPAGARRLVVGATGLVELRRAAAEYSAGSGLTGERQDDLVMAVSELASNSIEHAGSRATVAFWVHGAELILQVSDTGRLDDPLVGRVPALPHQPRGRGLLLVNHLADLVRTHTTPVGTTIQVRFAIPTR